MKRTNTLDGYFTKKPKPSPPTADGDTDGSAETAPSTPTAAETVPIEAVPSTAETAPSTPTAAETVPTEAVPSTPIVAESEAADSQQEPMAAESSQELADAGGSQEVDASTPEAKALPLHGAMFAVARCDNGSSVEQLLLGAGVTIIDAYDSYLCTHLLCENPDCAEAQRAHADGKQVVDRAWVQAVCQGGSPESAEAAATTEARVEDERPEVPARYLLPDGYVDAWDREHVRLPCSPRFTTASGEPLWHVVCRALHPPPADARALLGAMRAVRKAVGGRWRLEGLREFLTSELSEAEAAAWFGTALRCSE